MKKFFGIAVCILLTVCALVPALAFAAGSTGNVIYFLNPTAIAVLDDKLYVADNIEEGKSVILCFDVSDKTPAYRSTTEVNGDITNLSVKEGGIYAVLKDKVIEYKAETNSLSATQTFANITGAIDFVYGKYQDKSTEYYATTQKMYRNNDGEFWEVSISSIADIHDIVAIGDYVYYVFENDTQLPKLERWNGKEGGKAPHDAVNDSDLKISAANGLFVWNMGDKSFPAFFNDGEICYVEIAEATCSLASLMNYDTETNGTLVDVVAENEKLYVLNSQHKVEIYSQNGANKYESNGNAIGTETLPDEVPAIDGFKSFTLVQCNGYPVNIVFKTSGESSIDELIDDASEYIVLGYDGDENSDFYYVLIGDKFGWVKKSDGATTPQEDSKLRVIDTSVSQGIVEYKTKFNSLGSVWVYPLPRKTFSPTAFEQSATTRKDVTVLQRFAEGDTVWYYVRYDESKFGFVTEENIGKFYITANTDGITVAGDRKANGTLFGFVQLYNNNAPATMNDDKDEEGNYKYHAVNKDGAEIKHLGSGTRVTLIETYENGTALVQVSNGDGTADTGYCFADRLITVDTLTTNAVFGLVVTGIAVVLAVTLTVVFVRRNKRNASTTQQDEKDEQE